ncbi:ribonuclease H-like domain-containing protein [Tanacetum coccineum]
MVIYWKHHPIAGRAHSLRKFLFNITSLEYLFSNSSMSKTTITWGVLLTMLIITNWIYFWNGNVVDISDLKMCVGHPNGTLAIISHVGNLKIAKNVYACSDVLVDPKIMGTGSESGGLYLFDVNNSNCIGRKVLPHTDIHDSTQGRNKSDRITATQIGDQNWSEGNVQNVSQSSPTQNRDDVQTPIIRRSERQSRPPVRFNDYILNSNVKYGIEKYVSYSRLSSVNICFAIEALNRNNTWTVCDLPVGRKPISSKWIWKIKYKASGDIERYKARLVAKGFSQKEGFDYDKTFSPVVKMVTIRCLISIVVVNKWPLYQLDVNNAFLYGDLVEDVYVTLPDGYNNVDKSKVCKLNKSLYGLKQAPRQWNATLTTTLAEHGFEQSKFDYSLYTKHRSGMFIALLVYVDDIVIIGSDVDGINEFKPEIFRGLGYRVIMSGSQHSCDMVPFTVSFDKAALRVLRYLKGSPGCGVQFYKNQDLKLKAYVDADWAKCPKTKKFVTEYRSMSSASCEVVWLGNMLHSIGLKDLYPVELCCDNSSAIQIAANPVFHERTKHFELDVHFVREKVLAGVIKTVKVSSNLQTADVFTKCLGVVQHKLCCKSLGLLDIFAGELVGKDSGRKAQAPKKKVKKNSNSLDQGRMLNDVEKFMD